VFQPFHDQTRGRLSSNSVFSRLNQWTEVLCFNPFTAIPEDGGAVIQPFYGQTRGRRICESAILCPNQRTAQPRFSLLKGPTNAISEGGPSNAIPEASGEGRSQCHS
jgi:hypothetical protein